MYLTGTSLEAGLLCWASPWQWLILSAHVNTFRTDAFLTCDATLSKLLCSIDSALLDVLRCSCENVFKKGSYTKSCSLATSDYSRRIVNFDSIIGYIISLGKFSPDSASDRSFSSPPIPVSPTAVSRKISFHSAQSVLSGSSGSG